MNFYYPGRHDEEFPVTAPEGAPRGDVARRAAVVGAVEDEGRFPVGREVAELHQVVPEPDPTRKVAGGVALPLRPPLQRCDRVTGVPSLFPIPPYPCLHTWEE